MSPRCRGVLPRATIKDSSTARVKPCGVWGVGKGNVTDGKKSRGEVQEPRDASLDPRKTTALTAVILLFCFSFFVGGCEMSNSRVEIDLRFPHRLQLKAENSAECPSTVVSCRIDYFLAQQQQQQQPTDKCTIRRQLISCRNVSAHRRIAHSYVKSNTR